MDRARQRVRDVCTFAGINADDLPSGSERRDVCSVRQQLASDRTREFDLSLAGAVRQLGVSTSAIWETVERSRKGE